MQTIALNVGVAGVYFLSARVGMITALIDGNVSPLWPASGVAIAAVYIWGYRACWGTGIGGVLFTISTGGGIVATLGTGITNAAEPFLAVFLLRTFIGGENPFRNAGDVFKYFFFGGLLPTAFGALLGMTFFCYAGIAPWSSFWYLTVTFWLGDFMGAVMVAPFLLVWQGGLPARIEKAEAGEAIVMAIVLLSIYAMIFLEPISIPQLRHPLAYLCVPLMVWPAFRFQQRGAVTATLGTSTIAIIGTMNDLGPFAGSGTNDAILMLHFFLGVTSMMSLVLGAAVSERRRAQASLAQQARELARSNADLEQFAYVASHDLQEPLRMVSTYCQLLDRKYGAELDDDGRTFLYHSVEGARRMRALIQDLLTYARVGRGPSRLLTADCEQLLSQALSDLRVVIVEKGVQVTHDPLPRVYGDPTQLSILFQNLLSNGIKYCEDAPPHLHVSAQQNGKNWVFSVTDNGIGIDPEHHQRIFLIFQRLHSKDEYSGTGIGLAICKKIVEYHGGRIWVDSQTGRGSVFSFLLPMKGTGCAQAK